MKYEIAINDEVFMGILKSLGIEDVTYEYSLNVEFWYEIYLRAKELKK